MMGKTYRYLAVIFARLGFTEASIVVFVVMFFTMIEGRAFSFPFMLVCSWLFSRPMTWTLVKSILGRRIERAGIA